MMEIEKSKNGVYSGTESFSPPHPQPMLYVLIRYIQVDEHNRVRVTGILERLHHAFHGNMDLVGFFLASLIY